MKYALSIAALLLAMSQQQTVFAQASVRIRGARHPTDGAFLLLSNRLVEVDSDAHGQRPPSWSRTPFVLRRPRLAPVAVLLPAATGCDPCASTAKRLLRGGLPHRTRSLRQVDMDRRALLPETLRHDDLETRTLNGARWPEAIELRVRIALHTAEAELRDDGAYFGLALSRCARLRAIAHGGQTLVSRATRDLVADLLPDGVNLVDCGEHRLRDLGRPEHVFAVTHPDLPDHAAPLLSLDSLSSNLLWD